LQELAEGWRQRLEKELKGFADRGVPPQVECEGTTLSAQWIARDKEKSELFGLSQEGALRWIGGPTGDASYQDFLASESMADFGQLAAATTRGINRIDRFVPSDAKVDTSLDSNFYSATPERISELADRGLQGAEGRTELFFLKGDPGAGKTSALKEATAAQAERYLAGETNFLFFYVSAQGRELSNLRDAFSGELQDLRAALPGTRFQRSCVLAS
jgi:IS5 family transposase